jgi:hypothetical protein
MLSFDDEDPPYSLISSSVVMPLTGTVITAVQCTQLMKIHASLRRRS